MRPAPTHLGRALLIFPLAISLSSAAIGPAAEVMTERTLEAPAAKAVRVRYLLFTPEGYQNDSERRWPLLLFLHGSGERGDNLKRVAVHGPPKLLRGGAGLTAAEENAAGILAKNFIVVSPQCPAGQTWDDDVLLALLDSVEAELKVDPKRVYLTGLSMGGYGAWSLAFRSPERFAAVVPICGGARTLDLFVASNETKASLRSLGIWAFHGAKDDRVPVSESERLVALLKRGGARDLTLTVYPAAGHDSWTETYANPELYTWLLRHERAPRVRSR